MSTENENYSAEDWFLAGQEAYWNDQYEKAVECYLTAAEMGDSDAMYQLGNCYAEGEGVEKDPYEAFAWYQKAALLGNKDSWYAMGDVAFDIHRYSLAIKCWQKAVEMGNKSAKLMLGILYKDTRPVNDYRLAARWLREAVVDDGCTNRVGIRLWAQCLEFGLGVDPDVEEAKRWYQKAADEGDEKSKQALEELERIYSIDGTAHDWQQNGVTAWNRAYEALGRRSHSDTHADRYEAVRWWIRAADAGNVAAMKDLGAHLGRGHIYGLPADKKQAHYWYLLAALMGDGDAQRIVTFHYYYGTGVERNVKEARKWGRKFARSLARSTVQRGRVKWYMLDKLGIKGPRYRIPRVKSKLRRPRTLPFLLRILLFALALLPIVLVFHMDRLTFVPITEEQALERAETVKVTIPGQTVRLVADGKEKKLAVGSKVTVLGVYKKKLDKGNSPRVYWTNQQYLMRLRDGSLAHGPLMETAVGHPTLLPSGDTVVVKSVKQLKKNPKRQVDGEVSAYSYAYTLEGHKETYALEDLKMYFPERVAYQYSGLQADTIEAARTDTLANGKRAFWPTVRYALYKIIPSTRKSGYFLYPRFQQWNEFLLQRWFRSLLTFVAFIAFLLILFRWVPRIPRHIREAIRQIRFDCTYLLARCNTTSACYALGRMCQFAKNDVPYNMDEAVKWYTRSGMLGNKKAALALGRIYEQRRQYNEATTWYARAGEKGEEDWARTREIANNFYLAESYNRMAIYYEQGDDYGNAFEYFLKGAELGHPILQYNVAQYYYYGNGMAKDVDTAFRWYLKSAEQDYAEAQSKVGYCYCTGTGVAKNMAKGIDWMRKAARQGDEVAIDNLRQINESW